VVPHYFGHDEWAESAVGLKTIEDALEMRRRILCAFEEAERETDPAERQLWMRFVVIGAGSAGVELSGALGELAHETLRGEFQHIDPNESEVLLVEAADRILSTYPPELSAKAERSLARLGVTVRTETMVTDIADHTITIKRGDEVERLEARTILWTAGIRASPMAQVLAERTGAILDRLQRVVVEPDLSIAGYPDIFVVGDLASFSHNRDRPLPALAPAAIQEGQYVAKRIRAQVKGKSVGPFRYLNKGNLAVIGRNAAIAHLGPIKSGGIVAWLLWVFVHIYYLIGFDQKVLVMFRWVWNYFTRRRGARLITK
jgi:NADH dehydrogenase